MPSYRYLRDIKPEDLKKPEQRPQTKKEKAKTWFYYHWLILGGIVVVAVVIFLIIYSMVTKEEPDITIGVLSPDPMPQQVLDRLGEEMAPIIGDLNGDGQALVVFRHYSFDAEARQEARDEASRTEEQASSSSAPASYTEEEAASLFAQMADDYEDPYIMMGEVIHFSVALQDGEPLIFLADTRQMDLYQQEFGLFGTADGTVAADGADPQQLSIPFDETILASLNLNFEMDDGTIVDAASLFENYRLGIRPYEGTKLESAKGGLEQWAGTKELYDSMSEGAA